MVQLLQNLSRRCRCGTYHSSIHVQLLYYRVKDNICRVIIGHKYILYYISKFSIVSAQNAVCMVFFMDIRMDILFIISCASCSSVCFPMFFLNLCTIVVRFVIQNSTPAADGNLLPDNSIISVHRLINKKLLTQRDGNEIDFYQNCIVMKYFDKGIV